MLSATQSKIKKRVAIKKPRRYANRPLVSSYEAATDVKQPMNLESSTTLAMKREKSEARSIKHGSPSLGTSDTRVFDFDASGIRLYKHLQQPFSDNVDLQVLQSANRFSNGPGNGPLQLAFPSALMCALIRAHTGISNALVPTVGASRMSVSKSKFYVWIEENNHVVPFFNIMGTTMDTRLLNELALDRFRSAVHKHFPNLMDGVKPWEVEGEWVKAEGDIRGMGRLASWVDADGCVTLSAAQPGTAYQMDIRVTAQTVAMRTHM
ncbi:hypothetical protein DL764_007292 [Monosporascus ibericus]|uniref:Uncharacterized protein n=1 Tax=Monosporascus ibericus TaxID=155417 RepID=A0A4Q4T577_9PEZI|nr:hypothetical protein DL764_007292 [Monosporascus ibericus]